MSKASRIQKGELRLKALQEEFELRLIACLQESAKRRRWGLFGQMNNHPEARWLAWPEAQRVRTLAGEIRALRTELMKAESYLPLDRFLYYSDIGGPNAKGEPRLAQELLLELISNGARRR